MRKNIKRFVLFCFCSCMLLRLADISCCDWANAGSPLGEGSEPGGETITYEVELADPAFASTPARVHAVVQSRDRNGFPVGYALPVETHVCTDQKCKIVEATMFWDALGYYERIECPPDKPLTKKEHVPFDAEDYAKLDRILKDRDSILATRSLAFLAKPVETDDGIDAWTGATPLTVQESVVKDAAYTTWVLWRWANGEIVQKLRGLTEQSCTPEYLKHLLRSEDRRHADFALKYVMEHHPAEVQFVQDVFHVLENGDREHVAVSIEFLNRAMKDKTRLHARLIDSCCRMKSIYAPVILDYFAAQADLPTTTLEGLTGRLDRLPYYQVHLILRLLEQRKFFSEKTESDVSQLLASDNFFIARRACEYLMEQELDSRTEGKVNAFRERNRARL
jgi:hypothetical protein